MKPLSDPGDSNAQTQPPDLTPEPEVAPEPASEPKPVAESVAPAPEVDEKPQTQSEVEAQPEPTPKSKTEAEAKSKAKEKSVSKTVTADSEVEISEPVHGVSGTLGGGLGAEAMRTRLVDDPELVEPGLASYRDPKTGAPAGAEYSTDVGTIDLLAEGSDGALVVVMVTEAGGDPVGPVLEQLGWISKHLATEGQAVRAIVLLDPPASELGYAARAVADTVAFKTWRVAIAIDDVEV